MATETGEAVTQPCLQSARLAGGAPASSLCVALPAFRPGSKELRQRRKAGD